ncbi:MAG: DegT/DnrJ/EryC1/StrS family aminotransferase [Muribaculaceae bacterium]|nr:DegT/DnrJ/EryC1/StrS family aminotransferase [Muribaculaceae bacterium]
MRRIPFCDLAALNNPMMADIEQALLRVAVSGRYVGGTEVSVLEKKLCRLTGAEYAIGTGNGLDALKLIMRGWIELGRLQRGDEVIVAANTYVASILAIEDAGLVPLPVDPDPATMLLSAEGVRNCAGKRVKGVMPVHLYGRANWDEELVSVIKENGLLVIEDNAQAIGARPRAAALSGQRNMTGALGDAGALSFYPTKNVGALGDAGAVLTDDRELADAVRALSNYGSDRRYNNVYPTGCNSRLDPIQAAVLSVKLDRLESVADRRRKVAAIYDRMIDNRSVVKPGMPETAAEHVWHQYVVLTPDASARESFRKHLASKWVETDVHYAVPPHRQPCYSGREWVKRPYPVTCELADRVVSLPIATVSDEDAARVAEAVNSWCP